MMRSQHVSGEADNYKKGHNDCHCSSPMLHDLPGACMQAEVNHSLQYGCATPGREGEGPITTAQVFP